MAKVVRVPTGLSVGNCADLHVAVEIHPATANDRNVALVCLPGGGMLRQFYDLPVEGDRSFSFTQAMCAQGYTCVLVDHPGVGDSDRPDDGFLLNPALLAQAHANALSVLLQQESLLKGCRTVGVGHSMGAMVTLIQQSKHRSHDAIVLLGFGFEGLPQYLHPKVLDLLEDRPALNAQCEELARKFFRVGYPLIKGGGGGGGIYGGSTADKAGIVGIKAVSTHLLAVPAFMSMLPHHWDELATEIDVPVLVALGDKDLVKAPDNVHQMFQNSKQVELMVLPQTGHSQFLFASRQQLFARIGQWADEPN
ncbi:MAG: alpha/beta fold hydrolase [Oceanococcus sp.]